MGSTREEPPHNHVGESRGERKGGGEGGEEEGEAGTRHRERKKGEGEEGEGFNTTRPTSPQPVERDVRES